MTFKVSKASTYALNTGMINNSLKIQERMVDLQRQLATGVKHTTFEGYGIDTKLIQQYRADLESADSYIRNINITQVNIKQMNLVIGQVTDQMETVIGQATSNPQEGIPDTETLALLAENARNIIVDALNNKVGDRYLFAGSDVINKPYEGYGNLVTRVQSEMSDWLDQTNTSDQFLANMEGLTESQVGYSLTIQSAGDIKARASDAVEVDYTIKATEDGFKDLLEGLTVFTELKYPEEGTDLATKDDFFQVYNATIQKVIRAVDDVRNFSVKLSHAEQAIGKAEENHVDDRAALLTLLEATESVNTTEVATQFQAQQLQLEMSYQSTAILSQLSLSRYI